MPSQQKINCPEQVKKYQELKTLTKDFQQQWEKAKETGKIPKKLFILKDKIEKRKQEFVGLLEKYFLTFEFSEKIKGFNNDIYAFQPLGDNKFLVMGYDGETRILDLSDPQNPKYGEWIEGFDKDIETSQPLGDNKFLVMGKNGETRILDLSDPQNPQYGEWIGKEEDDEKKFKNYINASQPLGDNKFLVMGDEGETRILTKKLDLDKLE